MASLLPLLCLLLSAAPAAAEPVRFQGVERIVAVGDVHGDVGALTRALRQAGLVDAEGHWSGGRTHLVQTGDVADRGPHTRAALELLMRLEKEAEAAGGRVHALLGNHEVMNMQGDLRYVTPEELASYAEFAPDTPGTPRGLAGHRAAWGPEGRYGRWLRTRPALVQLNDTLFVHGGIAPAVPGRTLEEVNAWVREAGGVHPEGPLWFRGYALEAEAKWEEGLTRVLARFGARRMVVGHTVQKDGRIRTRFGGRLVLIDTGMSAAYGGRPSALELRGQRLTALYAEGRVPLLVPAEKAVPPVRAPATGASGH